MKKVVAWAIVLIMVCFTMCGCGGNKDINSMKKRKNDKIKFDDIEWMSERSNVEEKIKDILYDNDTEIKIENEELDGSEGLKRKQISKYVTEITSDNEKIGSIAGWDVDNLQIDYVSDDNGKSQYVYSYMVKIKREMVNSGVIFNDIKDKLNTKYKEYSIVDTDNQNWTAEWKDKNNNSIYMTILPIDGGLVYIRYSCEDVELYLLDIEEKYKDSIKLNDSKGL